MIALTEGVGCIMKVQKQGENMEIEGWWWWWWWIDGWR